MTRSIDMETRIQAPPEQVWSVLADFRGYAGWNPFIWNAVGEPRRGSLLLIQMQPPGGNPVRFHPRVTVAERPREIRWVGRLGSERVFAGEYGFRIEPARRNESRLIQTVRFSGAAASWVPARLYERQREGLQAMGHALQARVEGP